MTISRNAALAALALFATLVIGIVLGVLGVGAATRYVMRIDPVRYRTPAPAGAFQEHMLRVIEPSDSIQEAKVRVVVERAGDRNRALLRELNVALKASVDTMRTELAPMLTADQRERLERTANRLPPVREPGPPPNRRPVRVGPPPDGPPDRPPPP